MGLGARRVVGPVGVQPADEQDDRPAAVRSDPRWKAQVGLDGVVSVARFDSVDERDRDGRTQWRKQGRTSLVRSLAVRPRLVAKPRAIDREARDPEYRCSTQEQAPGELRVASRFGLFRQPRDLRPGWKEGTGVVVRIEQDRGIVARCPDELGEDGVGVVDVRVGERIDPGCAWPPSLLRPEPGYRAVAGEVGKPVPRIRCGRLDVVRRGRDAWCGWHGSSPYGWRSSRSSNISAPAVTQPARTPPPRAGVRKSPMAAGG